VFELLKKGGLFGRLKLSNNNQPIEKGMPSWKRIAF